MEIQRILQKFDRLMEDKDFNEAEKLLEYWITECEQAGDKRDRFTLLNELVGFYRMTGERPQGMKTCEILMNTVSDMDLEVKVSGATAYINIATAYKSFGFADKALPLYEKALEIYERELEQSDSRLPALYNNMALTLEALDYYDNAERYFKKALALLITQAHTENEQAITYLNMADLAVLKLGIEESETLVEEYVKMAYELLEKSHSEENSDFKMTAEKCIPVIRNYGYFVFANKLQKFL